MYLFPPSLLPPPSPSLPSPSSISLPPFPPYITVCFVKVELTVQRSSENESATPWTVAIGVAVGDTDIVLCPAKSPGQFHCHNVFSVSWVIATKLLPHSVWESTVGVLDKDDRRAGANARHVVNGKLCGENGSCTASFRIYNDIHNPHFWATSRNHEVSR